MKRPQTSDEWLAFAEQIEAWADDMRADLDAKRSTTRFDWTAWDLLQSAGGRLRGVAAQFYAAERT